MWVWMWAGPTNLGPTGRAAQISDGKEDQIQEKEAEGQRHLLFSAVFLPEGWEGPCPQAGGGEV